MEKIKIKFKKLSKDAIVPTKATEGSAGYDLYLLEDTIVEHGRKILPTGIAIEMPSNIKADVRPRSGFSAKGMEGAYVETSIVSRFDADVILGTVDSDYRNGIGVIVRNNGIDFKVEKGTRIAQLVFSFVPDTELVEVNELTDTKRGKGGFGHTGSK